MVRKQSTDMLMVVNVYSPDDSLSPEFISNYASINVADVLARVDGVAEALGMLLVNDLAAGDLLDLQVTGGAGFGARAAEDTLAAILVEGCRHPSGHSALTKGKRVGPDDLVADPNAETAENAVCLLPFGCAMEQVPANAVE